VLWASGEAAPIVTLPMALKRPERSPLSAIRGFGEQAGRYGDRAEGSLISVLGPTTAMASSAWPPAPQRVGTIVMEFTHCTGSEVLMQ
jgi:hypothetical protein